MYTCCDFIDWISFFIPSIVLVLSSPSVLLTQGSIRIFSVSCSVTSSQEYAVISVPCFVVIDLGDSQFALWLFRSCFRTCWCCCLCGCPLLLCLTAFSDVVSDSSLWRWCWHGWSAVTAGWRSCEWCVCDRWRCRPRCVGACLCCLRRKS